MRIVVAFTTINTTIRAVFHGQYHEFRMILQRLMPSNLKALNYWSGRDLQALAGI
jgi:hypothetical protein